MTDHLAAARAAIHAEHGWSMAAPASSLADMAYAIAHILDHLDAQRVDPQQLAASIRRGLDDAAAGRTEYLGRFADDEPEPDPLDEDNHADRVDRHGDRWVWCDDCDRFRAVRHEVHESGYSWSAVGIDEHYGPLTFAPRPAEPPTTAPQPDEAHGDAPDPARPAETHTDNIRAEAWEEGWRTGYADGAHYDDPRITPNPYRKEQP